MRKIGYLLFLILISSFGYAQKEKIENKIEMEKIISLTTGDSIQIENIWIKLTSNYRATRITGEHLLQGELLIKSNKEEKQIIFRISQEITKTMDAFDIYSIEWIEPDWNAYKQTFKIKKLN